MNWGFMIASFVLTLPVAIALGIWRRKRGPSKWQRREADAVAAGRVVTAAKLKQRHCHGDRDAPAGTMLHQDTYRVVYEYELNNRKYKYRCEVIDYPDSTVKLWYQQGKPGKAKPMGYNPNTISDYIITFLPFIVWGIIYWTLPLLLTVLYGVFGGA
jgi:hypothetical protein